MGSLIKLLISFVILVAGAMGVWFLYSQECTIAPISVMGVEVQIPSLGPLLCSFQSPLFIIGNVVAFAALYVGAIQFFKSLIGLGGN